MDVTPTHTAPENVLEPLRIGELLRRSANLTEDALEKALVQQREKGGRLGEVLVRMELVTGEDVARALSAQSGLPFVEASQKIEPNAELLRDIPVTFAKRYEIVPVSEDEDGVLVLASDPYQISAADDLAAILGKPVHVSVASSQKVLDVINAVYQRETGGGGLVDQLLGRDEEDLSSAAHELEGEQVADLIDDNDEAPVIRFINSLIFKSVKDRASDIHIEPAENDIAVRFRVDGVLRNEVRAPKFRQNSIISRVKIMAGLNIAEKRLPQDGRIRTKIAGKDIDIRVSTLPTSYGERVVMRLLDRSNVVLDLKDIGIPQSVFDRLRRIIHLSHGIFLVTGPTGSGKTTTLYGCLSTINSEDINIITVEDPVEYQLRGISQIQVQTKIDLTFAAALRSILRQDPDVVLIGEMRDLETAEIAIQASLTGHLVFSTLHTNDSASAVTRLTDMGVEPFLVASSVVGIMAQRLVRTICPSCRVSYEPLAEDLKELGLSFKDLQDGVVWRGTGCPACQQTGYRGRTGIYELMLVSDKVRQLIMKNTDSGSIKKQSVEDGMRTLRDDGAEKVIKGMTTIEEVLRVTQEDTIE